MDAIEFIHERNRMRATYTPKRCEGCPADHYAGNSAACIMVDNIDAEKLVPIVEKWSSEHPRKTRQSVFLEQYPEAFVAADGILYVCPKNVSAEYRDVAGNCVDDRRPCDECRRKFWSQEVG